MRVSLRPVDGHSRSAASARVSGGGDVGATPPVANEGNDDQLEQLLDALHCEPAVQGGASLLCRGRGYALLARRRAPRSGWHWRSLVCECRSWPPPDRGGGRAPVGDPRLCALLPDGASARVPACRKISRDRAGRWWQAPGSHLLHRLWLGIGGYSVE